MVRKWSLKVFLILWFSLGVSFTILAISLTVAASGYRVNWQARTLTKTSLLVLDSEPPNAAITINGKILPNTTPVRQSYLLPGFYELTVASPGYRSWQKTLKLEAGLAYYEENIVLYKDVFEDVPLTEVDKIALLERLAETKPVLEDDGLQVRSDEIWIKDKLIARMFAPIKQIKWLPNKRGYLVQLGQELHAYQRDGTNDTILATFDTTDPAPFFVDQDSSRLVYKKTDQPIALKIR